MTQRKIEIGLTILFTGFIGLSPEQIKISHPLSSHLIFHGKDKLKEGLLSVSYWINPSLGFLFIIENERVVAQKTYSNQVGQAYNKLYSIATEIDNENGGFYITVPQGKVYINKSIENGFDCLIASLY